MFFVVYLLVGYFYFSSLNFWKRRCDKASTEQDDHFKNIKLINPMLQEV